MEIHRKQKVTFLCASLFIVNLSSISSHSGVILLYLLRIAKVLVIGLRYYPVLAAVYIDSILTLACATVYAWLDFSISIIYQSWCQNEFYPTDDNFAETNGTDVERLFKYYGTGQNLIIIQVCTDIPKLVCWSYIVIKLPFLLISSIQRAIKNRRRTNRNLVPLTREERLFLHSAAPHSIEMSYVRNLFRGPQCRSTSRLFIGRLIPTFIYEWRDDFRFSSRILCLYATVFFILYFLTVQLCVLSVPYMVEAQKDWQSTVDSLTMATATSGQPRQFTLPMLKNSFICAVMSALVVTVIQVLVLLANLRRNLFQLYRGDDSEVPKRDSSRYTNYATGNFHFAGFFIGYLVWGYILVLAFTFILYVCIDAYITFGSVHTLDKILKRIIPLLLLIFFKQYLNNLLARYVFLQAYGKVLAVNNRRALMIFLYFNFFLDAFLGLISSVLRIIKSILGGFFYMCRLDYSPLGRKLELFDSGYSAYCGFIHIEAAQRNPIMLAMASYLYGRAKAKASAASSPSIVVISSGKKKQRNSSPKALQKWHVAVFLIRNPSFVFMRKKALLELENEKMVVLEKRRRKLSHVAQMTHRPSLISEIDLQTLWERK